MSVRVSLHGMLRLIRTDALRSVHTVGFLVERLKCTEDINKRDETTAN